jgi:secreted Zn-dependent insulinase-like peptidase
MDNRIMHFLQNSLREKITNMKSEEFKESVDELIKVKLEKPKRLQQKCLRDWAEIQEGTLRFDRHVQEVEALKAMSQRDFIDFVNTFIIQQSTRKMLRVHIQSQQSERAENGYIQELETPGSQIQDVFQWKREQYLLPSSYDEL